MLSDSPYQAGETVLTPAAGAAAGLSAALLMLLVISLPSSFSGLSLHNLLTVIPDRGPFRPAILGWAAGLYAAIGAILGLLYAVCQQRIPIRGLVAVGVFYGIVIWVASRVLALLPLGSTVRPALHSYPWLVACVAYGLWLAGCAAWIDRHRPRSQVAIPVD